MKLPPKLDKPLDLTRFVPRNQLPHQLSHPNYKPNSLIKLKNLLFRKKEIKRKNHRMVYYEYVPDLILPDLKPIMINDGKPFPLEHNPSLFTRPPQYVMEDSFGDY